MFFISSGNWIIVPVRSKWVIDTFMWTLKAFEPLNCPSQVNVYCIAKYGNIECGRDILVHEDNERIFSHIASSRLFRKYVRYCPTFFLLKKDRFCITCLSKLSGLSYYKEKHPICPKWGNSKTGRLVITKIRYPFKCDFLPRKKFVPSGHRSVPKSIVLLVGIIQRF